MNHPTFYPIIDNGMGLSVTSWAFSMLAAIRGESIFCHISTPYPGYAMNVAPTSTPSKAPNSATSRTTGPPTTTAPAKTSPSAGSGANSAAAS